MPRLTRKDFDHYTVRWTDKSGSHEARHDMASGAMEHYNILVADPSVWSIFWTTARGYVFAQARMGQVELPLMLVSPQNTLSIDDL